MSGASGFPKYRSLPGNPWQERAGVTGEGWGHSLGEGRSCLYNPARFGLAHSLLTRLCPLLRSPPSRWAPGRHSWGGVGLKVSGLAGEAENEGRGAENVIWEADQRQTDFIGNEMSGPRKKFRRGSDLLGQSTAGHLPHGLALRDAGASWGFMQVGP